MKKILPIIFALCFIFGIVMICTCDDGMFSSYYPAAMLAGSTVSIFAGLFLAISLHAFYKDSK